MRWRFTPLSPMAASKLFIFSMFFALLFIRIASKKSHLEPEDAILSVRIELEQLKSKVSLLETRLGKSNHEIWSKDDEIKQMENIILEKSESIASLQNKIETLQVDRLKKEMDMHDRKMVGLEVQANIVEEKTQELNIKLENLQKFNCEQKTRIHKTEQTLQVAEEEMMKAEQEATFMESVKIQVMLSQVRRDGEMFIETFKTEWIPIMKDQLLTFISHLSPHFESLSAKTIEAYHATKNSLLLHTVKVQKAATPFIQEAHKYAKIYINQIGTATKPYIDMAVATLEPYSRKPVGACRMFVSSASSYHKQVQQMLKTNELTKPLASMELAWLAATALLCLPVTFLCKLYSAIFRKKTRKCRRISHISHIRRKSKRSYPD